MHGREERMGVAGSNRADNSRQRRGATPPRPVRRPPAGLARPLHFDIPSEFAAGRIVQQEILDRVDTAGFSSQGTFAIKLALEEALINAIKHGNQFDPAKRVKIDATVTAAKAEIIVEDQGSGFNRGSVPDPTLEENIDKPSGRGILLMEAYMSSVEWSLGGRRVRMTKNNEPDDPQC